MLSYEYLNGHRLNTSFARVVAFPSNFGFLRVIVTGSACVCDLCVIFFNHL